MPGFTFRSQQEAAQHMAGNQGKYLGLSISVNSMRNLPVHGRLSGVQLVGNTLRVEIDNRYKFDFPIAKIDTSVCYGRDWDHLTLMFLNPSPSRMEPPKISISPWMGEGNMRQ